MNVYIVYTVSDWSVTLQCPMLKGDPSLVRRAIGPTTHHSDNPFGPATH